MEVIGASWMQSAAGVTGFPGAAADEHAHESHDIYDGVDAELAEEDGVQPLDPDATSFEFGALRKEATYVAAHRSDVGSAMRTDETGGAPSVRTADPTSAAPAIRMTTAAQLEGAPPREIAEPISPEVFRQDMLVTHPEYGLGRIVSLSGAGPRRQATVSFVSGGGPRKFFLLKSPLRPAK
jgi:DNA helicase-2/ATP-dependent DNA helicase PcrA